MGDAEGAEQILHGLVREAEATGPTYRTTLRATIRSSYRGHYRRTVLDLLAALDFRSNNEAHRPVIGALALVRRYAGTRADDAYGRSSRSAACPGCRPRRRKARGLGVNSHPP